MEYIAILGRQPDIGMAELESLYGPGSLMPINRHACFVGDEVDFARLGSSVKLLTYLETVTSKDVAQTIRGHAVKHIVQARRGRDGKLQLGISVYGSRFPTPKLNRAALDVKKSLKTKGFSVRLVPNKQLHLNAAQILRNKLTKQNGFELNIIVDENKIHLARTLEVQDIDAYAYRDRQKPVRDPAVGMLPPKLAQTLINMTGCETGQSILDPFCGTGTVLIEAFAMNIASLGSDKSAKMVAAAQKNLEWFTEGKTGPTWHIEQADAALHHWTQRFDAIAGETFLGPPLSTTPRPEALQAITDEVDGLHRAVLKNLARQIPPHTPISLAIPSWFVRGHCRDLPVLDDLEKLGYNPVSFVHTRDDLVYHRPQQVVGRRILNLIRK